MQNPVSCDRCHSTQVGWYYTFPETYTGQDPPEIELFNEECFDAEGNYCEECWEEMEEVLKEERAIAEAEWNYEQQAREQEEG